MRGDQVADAVSVEDSTVVEGELLPAAVQPAPRPLIDQHTILCPGDAVPTEADTPTYTRADFEVSATTADRLRNKAAPANTNRNYSSQRRNFAQWCEEMGRVARPCTTATYVDRVAGLIPRGMAPNTIRTYMSRVRTWVPEGRRPGTTEARGMLAEYRKEWGKRNRVRKAPASPVPGHSAIIRLPARLTRDVAHLTPAGR